MRRSPVSDDGRGLKLRTGGARRGRAARSPVSDDGRGLKQRYEDASRLRNTVRPSVMTGVD